MLIYVETRTWLLNARLLTDNLFSDAATPGNLAGVFARGLERATDASARSIADTDVTVSIAGEPWASLSYGKPPPCIAVVLKRSAITVLAGSPELAAAARHLRLDSVRIEILVCGLVRLLSAFAVTSTAAPLADLEDAGQEAHVGLNRLGGAIEDLVAALERNGILLTSPFCHFGVPDSLQRHGLMTRNETYLFNHHLMSAEAEVPPDLRELLTGESPFEFGNGTRVWPTWSIYYWQLERMPEGDELSRMLAVDALGLGESTVYSAALQGYTTLTENLEWPRRGRRAAFTPEIHAVISTYNWTLQRIRALKGELTERQAQYLARYRATARLEEKRTVYRDAEDALRFAVQGLEADAQERVQRTTQFVLALITALTLYSVASDVVSLLKDPDFTLVADKVPVRLGIFAGATLLFVIVLLTTYRVTFPRNELRAKRARGL